MFFVNRYFLQDVNKPNVDKKNKHGVMLSQICSTFFLDSLLKAKNLPNDLKTS